MKKLIAIVLAVMLAISCTIAVSAANATPGTTTLTTSVPDAEYTLNIPADQEIPFGTTKKDIGEIKVTQSNYFAEGKNLKVTLNYTEFTCEGVSTTIPFYIQMKDTTNGTTILQKKYSGDSLVFLGQADKTVTQYAQDMHGSGSMHNANVTELHFDSNDWGKALGGDYTATITFSAEVVVE